MTFSCWLGKISSPVLRVQSLKNLKNHVLQSSSCVHVNHQSYHQPCSREHTFKELCDPKNSVRQLYPVVSIAKQFSTSSPRLASHKAHDHSKIWGIERVLSLSLLPLMPAALAMPCQQLDTAVALIVVIHTHLGLEAIIVDYIRPILFGDLAPKIGIGLLYLFSIITLAGLLNLIYNDIGLANCIINIWKK